MTPSHDENPTCRLCLYSGYQNWHILVENNEIMTKIQTCLVVQLSPNKLLPNHICQVCLDKIDDIYKFHQNIIINEKRLLHYLNNKEEYLFKEKQPTLKEDLVKNSQLDIKHTVFVEMDTEYIKKEVAEINSDHFCSEDESPLLVVKKEKKRKKNVKQELKSTNIKADPIKKFKCLMCFLNCETLALLFKHYNTEHMDKDYLESTKSLYATELRDGIKVYKCCRCDKNLFSKRCMDRHWILMHVKTRPFICKLCSRTYKTVADLVRHSRVHEEECRMVCTFNCGYSTVYKSAMNDHVKRHKNDFKYTCEDCGRGFNVQTSFTQHLNIHKGLKPFVCDLCGMAFTMDKYLYQHKIKVHEVSSSTKRYICVHCSQPFDSKHVLNQHLKEHGKIITFHLCDTCGKNFPTSSKLRIHKNSHAGLRPYCCSLCPKTFAKKCNLKLHEVTHTGEKNHTCSHCGKHYTQKSALQRHVTKHHSGSSKATSSASK